jgi:capsular exopolysaccharide synthesis family protein
LGKIFDALEKFSKEREYPKSNAIRKSDYEILMKVDEATRKIKVDIAPGSKDQRRLNRMMTYRLVRADGTLTPAGRAKYEEMKRRQQDAVPSKSETSPRVEGQTPPEIPAAKSPGLTASDWAVLMKYDRKTGNLLKYDPETGNLDQGSTAILKDPGTIQRLIDGSMLLPGGWLTPDAKRGCSRIEEKLKGKQFDDSAKKEKSAAAGTPGGSTPAVDTVSQTDMQALLDYDHDTLKLNMRNPLIIKDPQIVKHLLKSGLTDAAGKLSAKALVKCRVLENWNAELEGKQEEPAVRKHSAGEKLRKAAAKKQIADLQEKREKSDKSKLKVIHLKKEAPKLKKVDKLDKKPLIKEDAPEPAVKEREMTAQTPKKAPDAKAPNKVTRVKAALPDPQRPVKQPLTPQPPAAKKFKTLDQPQTAVPGPQKPVKQPLTPKPVANKREAVAQPPASPEKVPETRADAIPDRPQFVPGKAPQGFDRNALDKNLVSLLDPQSFEAEQFKILRTNLLFPESGRSPRSVMVTSAVPGEGKSFVAANLAVSVARHVNWNVLLMDCDLRRPGIHRQFGYQDMPGLSDYLSHGIALQPLLLKTGVDNLTILPGGKPPHNPSELLSSDRMSALLNEAATRYHDRLIIMDSPPPRLAAESSALARLVDGIILVVGYASTSRDAVSDLIDRMGKHKVLGAIINRFDARSSLYKSQYYGK